MPEDGKRRNTMNKYLMIFLTMAFLTGCQDRYRYPCQDPKNFNNPECSFEVCQVSHECPNYKKGEHDGK